MDVSRGTSPPDAARIIFGDRLEVVSTYVDMLSDAGVVRGLIGPREVPRLWERHILNCGVVAPALPAGASVADIGSGAGLPGMVWAIARPDVAMTLIEPLLRRTSFLEEVASDLGVDNVTVLRSRAEDVRTQYDIVTSRAVAALDKLARWSLPLVRPGGQMWAIKGSSAAEEIREAQSTVRAAKGTNARVTTYGEGVVDTPTTMVMIDKVG